MENSRKDQNFEIEKYVDAIKKAAKEAPVRKDDSIDISDLWVITSLPVDLIMECVKNEKFEMPSYVKKVTDRKKTILKNDNYVPLSKEEREDNQNKKDEAE